MANTLRGLLEGLDPDNDELWTSDGLPRCDVVAGLVGSELSREEITNSAPNLTRESVRAKLASDEETESGEKEPAPWLTEQAQPKCMEVPSDLDTLKMTPEEIFKDWRLLERSCAQLDELYQRKAKERDAIDDQMKILASKIQVASQVLERIRPKDHGKASRDVKALQDQSLKARAEKKARAQKFVEAGTTAADVARELSGSSKLDSAMKHRRPAPGSKRPNMLPLQRG